MTYEQALQIAIEELDEKIQCLSDTFNGHSARIESYIYDLAMARKALIQASKEAEESKREWVGLTPREVKQLWSEAVSHSIASTGVPYIEEIAVLIEAKLKEKNNG